MPATIEAYIYIYINKCERLCGQLDSASLAQGLHQTQPGTQATSLVKRPFQGGLLLPDALLVLRGSWSGGPVGSMFKVAPPRLSFWAKCTILQPTYHYTFAELGTNTC